MAKSEGSLGARLLVIAYGVALVAIGAYPIQQEYGGVFEFLSQKSTEYFGDSPLEKLRRPSSGDTRARLRPSSRGSNAGADASSLKSRISRALGGLQSELLSGSERVEPRAAIDSPRTRTTHSHYDELTNDDRDELDELLTAVDR